MAKQKIATNHVDLKRGIDHIGVSAVAVIHDGKGRILLQKRGPKARDEQGHWDVTGGAIEFGETITEAISREVREELQTEVLDVEYLTTYDAHREHNGQKTHWIAIVHLVKVNPKAVSIGEPHKVSELAWFTLHNLPQPMHSQFHKAHKVLVKHKLFVN